MVSTKPPSGMRDFLPTDLRRRQFVFDVIREVYEGHHFHPLQTPAMERIEILSRKYGDEGEQLMFKVLRRGPRLSDALAKDDVSPKDLVDMGLRYDQTVPLARVVARHQSALPRVFKCYQIGPVWRADRPARGRFREFYQCDVDVVGSTSPLVEVDVVTAAAECLAKLGFENFTIRVNDRRLLSAMMATAGVPTGGETADRVLVTIDKLDKIGADGVRAELLALVESTDLTVKNVDVVLDLALSATGDLNGLLEKVDGHISNEAVAHITRVLDTLTKVGLPAGQVIFDASLVRGLGYYTGPIFEVALEDFSGSVGGGGRYDNLIGAFLGREVPACGISLGVERLVMIMTERDMFTDSGGVCDVFVACFKGTSGVLGFRVASELRRAGLRVDVHPEPSKIKKQFGLAESVGARVVVIIGPDEEAAGEIRLKLMASGEQMTVAADVATKQIQAWIA